jgi:hypothetical protein
LFSVFIGLFTVSLSLSFFEESPVLIDRRRTVSIKKGANHMIGLIWGIESFNFNIDIVMFLKLWL